MRIMTNNIIQQNSAISMTNQDTNYPIENLYSNMLEEILQASDNTTTITVTLDEDFVVNSIFFGYHNVTSMTVVLKTAADATIDTIVFSSPEQFTALYVTERTNVAKLVITLTTTAIYVFMGNLSIGDYIQLHNVVVPFTVEHRDTSIFSQTDGGQVLFKTGITLQSFNVDCDKLSDETLLEFKEAYAFVHKGKCFWLDRYEDILTDEPVYGMFDASYHTTRKHTLTDLSFSFTEAK